jgi:hypothetical protein
MNCQFVWKGRIPSPLLSYIRTVSETPFHTTHHLHSTTSPHNSSNRAVLYTSLRAALLVCKSIPFESIPAHGLREVTPESGLRVADGRQSRGNRMLWSTEQIHAYGAAIKYPGSIGGGGRAIY